MIKQFSWAKFIGLTLHYLYSMKRNPARFIEIFVWPTFELVLFSFLAMAVNTSNNQTLRVGLGILMGVLFWNFFARIIQEIVAQFLDDAFSKNLQNIFIAPISLLELIMSLLTVSFLKMLISFIPLSFIMILFFPAFFSSVGINALFWVAELVYFANVVAILALGFIFLYGERLSFIGWLLSTLIQIFSCVFYPRSVLPFWLAKFSYFVPSSYVFETMRAYLKNGNIELKQLFLAALLSTLYLFAFLIIFRLSYEHARKQGLLTKI